MVCNDQETSALSICPLSDTEIDQIVGGCGGLSDCGTPLIYTIVNAVVKYCAPNDDPSSYYPHK